MSDRLSELRRQRALIEEHLEWLDREIAAAGAGQPESPPFPLIGSPPAVSPPLSATKVVAAALKASVAAPPEESPVVVAAAEKILDEYRRPPEAVHTDVKKGCFLYFFAALAAVGIGTVILYFALQAFR